jgi:hypothetical protein
LNCAASLPQPRWNYSSDPIPDLKFVAGAKENFWQSLLWIHFGRVSQHRRRKVAQNTNALFLTDQPTAQLYQQPKSSTPTHT